MKCTLTAQPIFWIDISLSQVQVLNEMSKMHYDAACRQASMSGGFLYGWHNTRWFEAEQKSAEPIRLKASFRDLDLCLKILEWPPTPMSQADSVEQMRKSFSSFLAMSNELVPAFSHEIEV